ncbi:class I glutamine amidotransferase-like protein [Mycena floridula]|nr:class I glutamine amidotransferase-like protein [Mycena floridula]
MPSILFVFSSADKNLVGNPAGYYLPEAYLRFYCAGKITAAVCHGTAALSEATDSQGKSIFVGKSFTGFSNAEEKAVNAVATIPFLLEDKITTLGGKYEKAADLFGVKVVVDGSLYTGQNPNSAGPLAKEILAALNK